MHDLADLRDANDGFGNKAAGLARLIAAGLPVPPGFVIAASVFERVAGPLVLNDLDLAGHAIDAAARRIEEAELTGELKAELRAHLKELGNQVIVRSSSPIEDGPRGGGAGVFESSEAVPNELERVWHAIRAVWTSALAPAAIAYARGRTDALRLGVIVQQFVTGARVTVYTRSPSGNDELVIQRGDTLVRTPRVQMPRDLGIQHAVIQALRAERVIGGPADVELVQAWTPEDGAERVFETWVVQARPIVVAPARLVMTAPPPIVIAPLQDGRAWTWDVTHNPDPLSPAQRGLVELVEREKLGAYELRMVAGYLYTSPRGQDLPPPRGYRDELSAALVVRCRELEAEAEKILTGALSSLDDALATYARFYALWANELSPRIAELRRRGRDDHAREAPALSHPFRAGGSESSPPKHRPSSVEAAIAACARGTIDRAELVRRIGAVSPTWDVAVPTFGERPELLQQAIAIARADAKAPARAAAQQLVASELRSENIDLDAIAADLAERDDLLFARAQQRVRTALLARGTELGIGDDIFWIELEQARPEMPFDPIAARRNAAAARAANARAALWQMPLVVGAPSEVADAGSTTREPGRREVLHGVGAGERVTGRVVRFSSLASAVLASRGDVVVVRAVTPALAVFVGQCAALVSETGGLLDHGAALARELGITCVVGCRDAWTSLHDNDTVDVDGDAGTVTLR